VATRKVQGLLSAGAKVRVISPAVTPELQELANSGELCLLLRPYQDGDLAGAFLAIAATDDTAVNESVWQEAQRRGCLINVVDDPAHSNFTLPAVLQRGDLTIAISTGGASPALARRLRERLEALIAPEYGPLVEVLRQLRPELGVSFPPGEPRLRAALRVIDSDIMSVLHTQGKEAALVYGRERMHEPAR
jgi:precorrin-2 dehydrogenase/sirohydrochlorin ferrochelatase